VQIANESAIDGTTHHVERALQSALDFFTTAEAFFGFGAQREFAEGESLFFGGVHRFDE
jgi:hypothetical protein